MYKKRKNNNQTKKQTHFDLKLKTSIIKALIMNTLIFASINKYIKNNNKL